MGLGSGGKMGLRFGNATVDGSVGMGGGVMAWAAASRRDGSLTFFVSLSSLPFFSFFFFFFFFFFFSLLHIYIYIYIFKVFMGS